MSASSHPFCFLRRLAPSHPLDDCLPAFRHFRTSTYLCIGLLSGFFWLSLSVCTTVCASVRTPGLINDAAKPDASINQQDEKDISLLEAGKLVAKGIKGGEAHTYRLGLTAGQFLHAVIEQRGIDVVVTLLDPDGKPVIEVDSLNGRNGPEPVWAIAAASGAYHLQVRPVEKEARPGYYEARIEELRVASQEDKEYVAGQYAFIEAERLRAQGSAADLRKAIAKYEEALKFRQTLGDRRGEATTLTAIGLLYYSLGEKQKALEYFNQALPILRAVEDRASEATTLTAIGRVYDDLGEKRKALEYFNQALASNGAVGDRLGEATVLNNIGSVYHSLGEMQQALDYYNRALFSFRQVGDRASEATALNNLGSVYNAIGEKQKALDYYNAALKINVEVGDRRGVAEALSNIGSVYDDFGDKPRALEYYNQALQIRREIIDQRGEAATLNNIGVVYYSLGEKRKALEYFDQVLPLRKALRDFSGEAATYNNLGLVYNSIGEKQKALEYFNQALPLMRAIRDRGGEAKTLNNLGSVYISIGETQKALEYLKQALTILQRIMDRSGEAATLNNLGSAYHARGDSESALTCFNRALTLNQNAGDRAGEAITLNNLGLVYAALGDKQQALRYYDQALLLHRAVEDRGNEATTLNHIGLVYESLGDKQKALDYFNQTLPILHAVGDRSGEAATLVNLGAVYQSLGEHTKALGSYERAILKLESVRAAATIEEIKLGLSGQLATVYQKVILLLLSMGRHTEAFELTERARARTFLDQVGNVHTRQTTSSDPHLVQEERALATELARLRLQLLQSPANREIRTAIQNQIASIQARYEELLVRLKLSNPAYVSLQIVDTLKLPEVQQLLDKHTSLLSYYVTPEKTVAFVITRDSFQTVEFPVREADLREAINWFRTFTNVRESHPRSLRQLYDWLIAPIAPYIKTRMLGILPHGLLHYLPFAALTDGRRYLNQDYAVFYLPSASAIPFIRKEAQNVGSRLLAVGQNHAPNLPPLIYAEEEAATIARLYDTRALTGRAATKTSVLARAGQYNILHLAAHAELNVDNPLFSRIILAPDRNKDDSLTTYEIYDLDLHKTSMVVLSTSETQLGEQSQGDDFVSLTRAFMYAGASTVIASLWCTDDKATKVLMVSFYRHLKKRMSKATALRAAQLEVSARYPNPYYWAAFVLTGDPGPIFTNKKSKR
jgi:CHAT domain-containing protein/Tfp pilus assembly protein PilF